MGVYVSPQFNKKTVYLQPISNIIRTMFKFTINSISELPQAAAAFFDAFKDERHFAFFGAMGAGKTTFIKALCQHMQTADNVTSPTFALVNEYDTAQLGKILHFDFYRLKDETEALDIGFDDYMESGCYCFMEWADRVERILPQRLVEVKIEACSESCRVITAQLIS